MQRRPELDSLRGLAAISVLLYHTLALNSQSLMAGVGLQPAGGLLTRILVFSPAHVVWLGAEAVWLFFVLSGFVLTRSTMRAGFSWSAYYPSRLVRLYVPVLAAVALAWLTYIYPHVLTPETDQLLPTSYPVNNLLKDVVLLGGTTTSLGVLWSLQWEVVFSLLLPVYVLLVRTHPLVTGAVAALLCWAGWTYNDPATSFLPMFFVGVLMAQNWDRLQNAFAFLASRRPASVVAGIGLALLSICGLTSFYLLGPAETAAGLPARTLSVPVVLAAIALLIVVAQTSPVVRRVLSVRPVVFLGTISFSLYLVHLPLVVLGLFILGRGPVNAVVTVVVALAAAVAFYYAIERPAHRLSRRVGARVRDHENQAAATDAPPTSDGPETRSPELTTTLRP